MDAEGLGPAMWPWVPRQKRVISKMRAPPRAQGRPDRSPLTLRPAEESAQNRTSCVGFCGLVLRILARLSLEAAPFPRSWRPP